MKTINIAVSVFSLAIMLASCNLERIDPRNNCFGNNPVADFTVSTTNIDLHDTILITNLSAPNEAGYEWDLGEDRISNDFNQTFQLTFSTAGDHDIILVVTNADGCSTTVRKTITVSNIVKFKKVLALGGTNITPLGVAERSDGLIHVLYKQGTALQSALVDPANINAALVPVPLDNAYTINTTRAHNGGFLLAGKDGSTNSAKVATVSANQIFTPLLFKFAGSTISEASGVIPHPTGSGMIVSGYGQSGSSILPGIATVGSNASVTAPLIQNGSLASYSGYSLVEKSGFAGNYKVAANQFSLPGSIALLVDVSQNGIYGGHISLSPVDAASKIVNVNATTYAVAGSVSTTGASYIIVVDANTKKDWPLPPARTVADIIVVDNNLFLCGNTGDDLYIGRFNLSNGTFDWSESYSLPNGRILAKSLVRTADGGFLVCGRYESQNNTQREFFLLKTDSLGKAD